MKSISFLAAALLVTSCAVKQPVKVTVSNDSSLDRKGEMVEVSMHEISNKLHLSDTAKIVVLNAEGDQIPTQVTYEGNLIFPVTVKANDKVSYTIKAGTPAVVDTMACGAYYPQRVDDVAWENDLIAFRTYGPALQASGEKAFGYDVWLKYNTTKPVVKARYALELNPATKAEIARLKKVNPAAADSLQKATTYHVDHGNGFDCYKVGPTLGGGAAAIITNDS